MKQLCSTAGSASIAAFTPLPISVATRQKGSEPTSRASEHHQPGPAKQTPNLLLWCLERTLGKEQGGDGSVPNPPLHPHAQDAQELPEAAERDQEEPANPGQGGPAAVRAVSVDAEDPSSLKSL